ncbi:RsiV family protein [Pseudomonas purpurea]|uniref:RsiV family protein n=1 Tax=Pseudomonas purpurea TaxID=3136737 RepID=UPI003266E831
MSLFKVASVACIALTLGACQSLFQPGAPAPAQSTRDASEQVKPGCTGPDCPLVNIDTVHFPSEPQLDRIIEQRLLQMTRTSAGAALPASLNAYREQFLREASDRHSMYLQAKVREQHDGLVIIELSSFLDTGAANGTPGRGFINYSRPQQKELSLSDMLLPGQEGAFWKTAQVAHNSWLINSKMDRDPDFVKNWPFQKTPNVALTSAGVVLKYNVATIAPYSMGLIEMNIPYARLKGLIKPELVPERR